MLNGWPGRVRTEQLECQRCVGGEAELRLTFRDYFEKASRGLCGREKVVQLSVMRDESDKE